MEMKNKLTKHHKKRMHFYMYDLAIVLGSIVGLFAIVTVPTYISLLSSGNTTTNTVEITEAKENVEEEKIETYLSEE